ncbi:baculoviral IAP repeat-containing protein 5-like [Tubulanus polymorphus]|uniref:baculoviral IAP repeat-containing protein 5-like n=1 Tax=Tubulanus polymorphus TaxID=672921 RepID=UPI003DA52A3C
MGMRADANGIKLGLHSLESRLETFNDWPFASDCLCTPEKMAEAGFVHCPSNEEPDLAKCYICLKELDGWEPTDDPWKEHLSHSAGCLFVQFGKKKHTLAEVIKLESARRQNMIMKVMKEKVKELEEYAKETREQMISLL